MRLTIDEYINNNYHICSTVSKQDYSVIKRLLDEVSGRTKFQIPCKHIFSYNVTSSVIALEENNHHLIIDYAVFNYAIKLLTALEYNYTDMIRYHYFSLRQNICLARCDYYHEIIYRDISSFIPMTDHGMSRELLISLESSDEKKKKEYSDIIQILIRFFFLHEYSHYMLKNPMRSSYPEILVDALIDDYCSKLSENTEKVNIGADVYPSSYRGYPEINDTTYTDEFLSSVYLRPYNDKDEISSYSFDMKQTLKEKNNLLNKLYDKSLAEKYYQMYKSNKDIAEELMCDNQSLLLLLELVQFGYSVETIVKAILTLMYTQFTISLAKSISFSQYDLDIIHLRMGIIIQFAKNLEDETFSDALVRSMNISNRFNKLEKLTCAPIDDRKYTEYLASLLNIHSFDARKIFDEKKTYSVGEPVGEIVRGEMSIFR